jgi:hypothetical protein
VAISPANPIKNTSTVKRDGNLACGGVSSMSGFTIVEARISMAKSCPFLEIGGSLEVSELAKIPTQSQLRLRNYNRQASENWRCETRVRRCFLHTPTAIEYSNFSSSVRKIGKIESGRSRHC